MTPAEAGRIATVLGIALTCLCWTCWWSAVWINNVIQQGVEQEREDNEVEE